MYDDLLPHVLFSITTISKMYKIGWEPEIILLTGFSYSEKVLPKKTNKGILSTYIIIVIIIYNI